MVFLMQIDRWDVRRDGPLSEAAQRRKLEDLGFDVARRQLDPGTSVGPQVEDEERIDAVVAGILRVTLEGESAILAPGDSVYVAPGSRHRLEALGPVPVLALAAVKPRRRAAARA